MELRRGFSIKLNERVLVVEDVVTTGGSVKEVIELLKPLGADIVGVGAIVDRTGGDHAPLNRQVAGRLLDGCQPCRTGNRLGTICLRTGIRGSTSARALVALGIRSCFSRAHVACSSPISCANSE